jgi:transposase
MEDIKVKTSRRPRTRPLEVLADAAYDDVDIRQHLRSRGIQSNIPINPRNTKTRKRGRPTRFNPETYVKRGAIERFIGWLKMGFRKLTTRYQRLNDVLEKGVQRDYEIGSIDEYLYLFQQTYSRVYSG